MNKVRNSLMITKLLFTVNLNISTHIREEHSYELQVVSRKLKD
jgi:hypothetical protein